MEDFDRMADKIHAKCHYGTQNLFGTINDNRDYEQLLIAIKGNFSLAPSRGKGARRAGKGL